MGPVLDVLIRGGNFLAAIILRQVTKPVHLHLLLRPLASLSLILVIL